MSYPDLGCFAECLTCELCETGLGPPSWDPDGSDLFPSELPDSDPYDLGDWAPEEDSPWWEDFGVSGDGPPFWGAPWFGDGVYGAKFGGTF